MKRRKLQKDNNAVIAPLEFTVAFGIFLTGLSLLFVTADTMFTPYDIPDFDVRAKAMEFCDVLIGNPGNPNNFDANDILTGNIQNFGLSYYYATEDKTKYGILDESKINALDEIFNTDLPGYDENDANTAYTNIKNSLNLDIGYIKYDFALIIKKSTDTDPSVYGKSYENAEVVKSFTRNILITNGSIKQDGTITVIFFS